MQSRTPKAGELWGRPNHPVVVVLRPQGSRKFLLATVNLNPKIRPMTMDELKDFLDDFDRVGKISQR